MFFQEEESSEIGRPAQTKLESFLFSKTNLNIISLRLWWLTRGALLWWSHSEDPALVFLNPPDLCWVVSIKAWIKKAFACVYIPGCELSSKVPFYTFQGDEEEDLEHFLELRTVCTFTFFCPVEFSKHLSLERICLRHPCYIQRWEKMMDFVL